MKILHVITGLNDGGAENVLFKLCRHSIENEHIVVSLSNEGKYSILLERNGFKVFSLNLSNSKNFIFGLWKLFRLIKYTKPDIVQTWMYHANLIGGVMAKFAGTKNIIWNVRHSNLKRGKTKLLTIWISKISALLSGWIPKKIIYCAFEAKKIHEMQGYKKNKSIVIYNGFEPPKIELENFHQKNFRSKFNLSDNHILLGMVGRYNIQKDHRNLFMALNLVKTKNYLFKIILVGEGLNHENSNISKMIEDNQLSKEVLLLGQLEDINAIMKSLDIHVLSSSFGEGFPNVLGEAMACGTPCIATDVGDSSSIIGETGWIVPPKNPNKLASAIIEAIDEIKLKKYIWLSRKKKCYDRILSNYQIDDMVNNYYNVWNEELKN